MQCSALTTELSLLKICDWKCREYWNRLPNASVRHVIVPLV